MALLQLNVNLLYSAVINACYALIGQREHLNAINVFPVADGDTGNNMAATADAIINYAVLKPSLAETAQSIANAAIIGSRGNSGMIFSQFFNGWVEQCFPEVLTTVEFSTLMTYASQSVRKAIINPVEGTMLTVIEAFSKALHEYGPTHTDFLELLPLVMVKLDQALNETTNTLKILQEAQVVDAGALGFSTFIKSFADYIANPHPLEEKPTLNYSNYDSHDMPTHGNYPEMRYCTEALVVGENINKQQLTKLLQQHGDSIVLTANQNLSRLHVHCNKPWKVFEELKYIGTIQNSKIDDMVRQYEVIHTPKYPIALVVDSSANIPQELLDRYQIHIIALNVHMNGHDLLDKWGLDNDTFYENVANSAIYPTTSCPSPAIIGEKLGYLSRHYQQVLVLSVAQSLSGTFNAMVNAAKDLNNVSVINSCHVAGSQGLLATYAASLIDEGNSAEDIKRKLHDKILQTYFFVMVNQFDSLIRSGRISKLKAKFAQFAGVRPIISLQKNQQVILIDKAFNEIKALSKIITTALELAKPNGFHSYVIIHAGVPEKAQEFAHMTTEAFAKPPLFLEPVSTAIGLHAGKGCIALAFILN